MLRPNFLAPETIPRQTPEIKERTTYETRDDVQILQVTSLQYMPDMFPIHR